MVKTKVITTLNGETIEAEILGKVNLVRDSSKSAHWEKPNIIKGFLGLFTHYEVNEKTKDEKGDTAIEHTYLPKSWVDKGAYP